eukprot:357023-Chlamydomonas_euryale.AAC.2
MLAPNMNIAAARVHSQALRCLRAVLKRLWRCSQCMCVASHALVTVIQSAVGHESGFQWL